MLIERNLIYLEGMKFKVLDDLILKQFTESRISIENILKDTLPVLTEEYMMMIQRMKKDLEEDMRKEREEEKVMTGIQKEILEFILMTKF